MTGTPAAATQPLHLRGDKVEVVVLPALGARMISVVHCGREYLWRSSRLLDDTFRPLEPVRRPSPGGAMGEWQNWGGDKSWPAPQGEGPGAWGGPPDAVLDAGEYAIVDHEPDRRVVLESAVDSRTGLMIRRSIELDPSSSGVLLGTTLVNASNEASTWAPWEVAQLPFTSADLTAVGAGISIENHRHLDPQPRTMVALRGEIEVERSAEEYLRVPFQHAVGKLGFPAASGAVSCRWHDGREVHLHFDVSRGASYPDDSPFQLWMQFPLTEPLDELGGFQPDDFLVELEPVGPLTRLAPGEAVTLAVTWRFGSRPVGSGSGSDVSEPVV